MTRIIERSRDVIENIIKMEWEMFQNVDNIGGRASCQDDFETFYIMRRTQYESWTEEMVQVYQAFVQKSQEEGRNLVAEKYARMMQYTHIDYYNEHLRSKLPVLLPANRFLIDTIVGAMVQWEKEYAAKYPKLAGRARPITADQDVYGFTSMETYARGELETYPQNLLRLYADYVKRLLEDGRSLSIISQEIMVKFYGYDSIDEAESAIR
jgi:hypothetical protein